VERPTDEVSNGLSIKYMYDVSGKRTGLSFPDGRDMRYEYSSAGNLIGIYKNSSGLSYPGNSILPETRSLATIRRIGKHPIVLKFGNHIGRLNYDPNMQVISVDWFNTS
jgi:YD repeat-containing protein